MTNRDSINPFKDDMSGRLLLGRYRILRRIATGGMGVVYLARAEGAAGFVKPVVAKLILPILASNREFSGMFAREARILANLQHPGIVSVLEFAEELGCYVMILEYVHGFQLGEWRKYLASLDRVVPTNVVIQVIINVLDALHYAHTLTNHDGEPIRIIHRDVSPANIMLDWEGHIKLVDFGIAFVSENTEGFKTTNRSFKGKLSYSAPELFSNQKASVQSDIYSAGITLHEMLRGKNEYFFADHASIVNAVLKHVPTSIHLYRDDAPSEIDDIIWKAVAKKPHNRYASAAEFADALRKVTSEPEHKSLSLLAELVKQDFSDEMAEFLGAESLRSRERAWRTPSFIPAIPTVGPPRPTKHDLEIQNTALNQLDMEVAPATETSQSSRDHLKETALGRKPPELRLPVQSSKSVVVVDKSSLMPFFYILAGVLLIGVIGLLAWLFLDKHKGEEKRFLLVQSAVESADVDKHRDKIAAAKSPDQKGVDKAGVAVALGSESTPLSGEVPTGEVPAKSATDTAADPKKTDQVALKRKLSGNGHSLGEARGPDMEALTQAFRKRKGKIQGCFEAQPQDLDQAPTMSVLFHLAPSGKVESVDLVPKQMSGTALGQCLIEVSKTTEFPPQKEAISFRIPLSAYKVQK